MITLDRSGSQPIHEQLVAQLRYLIARGHFRPGASLPSTRELARQLGISFHTVRKAYQQLEAEGLIHSQSGRRYLVRPEAVSTREMRLEQGAALLQETLRRLVGIGLSPEDIEYLLQEQLSLLEDHAPTPKVLCLAPTRELAESLIAALGAPGPNGSNPQRLNRSFTTKTPISYWPAMPTCIASVPAFRRPTGSASWPT
ncbi:GntR family transcriptional regulator [Rhodothermus marinus]|uniref:GntR family transcriptional regulator n=1 Tax=Rhodothermus marinus TaxID=29549 RepID=UPI000ADA1630|nr:GntR family transcriptional regulator [Rhodothermus marinus]